MKELKIKKKKNFIRKLFVKLCRIFGYEIIDQSDFEISTTNKSLNSNLSILGKKSINIPLGEVKVTRSVKSLDIIIRTCMKVNMLQQNKKRIFEKNKAEYTLRTINSLINSYNQFDKKQNVNIKFKVIDHASEKENLDKIKNLFTKKGINFQLINLDVNKLKGDIKEINEKNEKVSFNQISNMCNIYQSLLEAKNADDLVYFVEDDYIHSQKSLGEMIYAYERISSQIDNDLFLCPVDYPYLYAKIDDTKIILGNKCHWRKIDQTLCSFFTSKKMVIKYWENLSKMCKFEHQPFEKPLHLIYEKELCLSPIPSLAIHCTNINSVYGISPNLDIKKIWDESSLN